MVGTTHLIYNSNRGDIKLAQLDLVTQCLAKIKHYLHSRFKHHDISVLLCGDFNSIPHSGIYQYMKEGQYDWMSQNRDEISGQT